MSSKKNKKLHCQPDTSAELQFQSNNSVDDFLYLNSTEISIGE